MKISTYTHTIINNKLPSVVMEVKVEHGTITYTGKLMLQRRLAFKSSEIGINTSKTKVKDWLWFDEDEQLFRGKDAQRINKEFARLKYLIENDIQNRFHYQVVEQEYKVPSWEVLQGTIDAAFENRANSKGVENFEKIASKILHERELTGDMSVNTLNNYRQTVRDFVGRFLPSRGIKPFAFTFQDFTIQVLNDYLKFLKAKNSNETVEIRVSHLRSLYEGACYYFAVEVGNKSLLTQAGSPFEQLAASKQYLGIKKKKKASKPKETDIPISETAFMILRNFLPSEKAEKQREYLDYFLLQCSMGGLRISELLNLRYEDIDLHNGTFSSLSQKTGKYRNGQIFDILGITRAILMKYWKNDLEGTNAFVLPIMQGFDSNKPHAETKNLCSRIDVTLKKVGLQAIGRSISTHDSRKFIANYTASRMGIGASQMLLGHTSSSTTENYYLSEQIKADEVNKIIEAIK